MATKKQAVVDYKLTGESAWGRIETTIEGTTPLLMHNPISMTEQKASRKKDPDPPEVEAEKGCYWSSNTGKKVLIIKDTHIKGCLLNSAKSFKTGRRGPSLSTLLAGQVKIHPPEISLGTNQWEADVQSVVIRATKGRILRGRAKVMPWKASFQFIYHIATFPDTTIIKEILQAGGQFVGLLDFRPEKKGSFGQFKVTKWQEARK